MYYLTMTVGGVIMFYSTMTVGVLILYCFFIFFFQAEDGIRDLTVTGVQTCALPICFVLVEVSEFASDRFVVISRAQRAKPRSHCGTTLVGHGCARVRRERDEPVRVREIGRASCRERV